MTWIIPRDDVWDLGSEKIEVPEGTYETTRELCDAINERKGWPIVLPTNDGKGFMANRDEIERRRQ